MRDILHYIWISLSGQAYDPFPLLPERKMNHHLDTVLRCNNKDECMCVCLQVESEVMTLKSYLVVSQYDYERGFFFSDFTGSDFFFLLLFFLNPGTKDLSFFTYLALRFVIHKILPLVLTIKQLFTLNMKMIKAALFTQESP